MDFGDLLQPVLETLIQVFLPILMAALMAWIKAQFDLAKAKIPAEQLVFAQALVRQLVLAAEQNGLTGALDNLGASKREWVLGRLDEELKARKIKLDTRLLADMIEAVVIEEFNQAFKSGQAAG